jgi:hypothetical protein
MKTLRVSLLAALVLTGAGRLAAFDHTGPRVEVVYFEPAHFTDARDSYPEGTDKGREAILTELKSDLVKRALPYVAPGQKLTITITDIDLAGDFEPWRGPQWGDVRIVKDIYPPAIELTFQLKDADGNIVKSGKRSLRDLAFQMRLMINKSDRLRYEKAMLGDWLSDEFGAAKRK